MDTRHYVEHLVSRNGRFIIAVSEVQWFTAVTYGPMKKEDLNRLERAEHRMMRRMCGVTLRDRVWSKELFSRLGIESISSTVTKSRLRWYGHVQRKDDMDWVKRCLKYEVSGNIGRGQGRKTWKECVQNDLKGLNLDPSMAADREPWRRLVPGWCRARVNL